MRTDIERLEERDALEARGQSNRISRAYPLAWYFQNSLLKSYSLLFCLMLNLWGFQFLLFMIPGPCDSAGSEEKPLGKPFQYLSLQEQLS